MPDGYPVRFLDGSLVKFEVGTTGELLVELEDGRAAGEIAVPQTTILVPVSLTDPAIGNTLGRR
jgi:hypothetical protein